jgi:hypothetical protein
MIVEYIPYSVDDRRTDAVEQAYRRAAEVLEASEHLERNEGCRR